MQTIRLEEWMGFRISGLKKKYISDKYIIYQQTFYIVIHNLILVFNQQGMLHKSTRNCITYVIDFVSFRNKIQVFST